MKLLISAFSLLSVFIVSCSGGKPLPVHHVVYDELSEEDVRVKRSNNTLVTTYNSNLQFQEEEYNGKLYLKRMGKGHYKIAYTTDTDFKLYALEITDSSINWEYCFSKMNNKFVQEVLERDFRALLALVPQDGPALVSREERPHTILGNEKRKVYAYWTDKTRTTLYKSMYVTNKETLVIVHYLDFSKGFPQRIKLVDHKSNLAMTLNRVN